jgi:hypothetical protein
VIVARPIVVLLVVILVAAACKGGPAPSVGETGEATTESGATGTSDGDGDADGALACNGSPALCDRPFDQVAFPATHNANSAADWGYSLLNANHQSGMDVQLESGIRAMLIDVTYDDGETTMCHYDCNLGSTPHLDGLAILADFLDAHPREVLTIIYQDSISVKDMVADFETAGLIERVYSHPDGAAWPTLGEMIDADTRLVVTAESGGPPPAWFHHVWDVGFDTPFDHPSLDEMSCGVNRGDPTHDLFLMNHWVNNAVGPPSQANANTANALDFLVDRAMRCWDEQGRIPNFLAVDFFEEGDVVGAAEIVNGLR